MLSMTQIHDVWGKADTVNSAPMRTTCIIYLSVNYLVDHLGVANWLNRHFL